VAAVRTFIAVLALAAALPASAAEAPVVNRVVELPPFLVSDTQVPLHWRYAASERDEVLSVCSDAATQEFMRQIDRLHLELRFVLPPEFQARQSLPVAYILCGDGLRQRLERDIPAELLARRDGIAAAAPAWEAGTSFHVLPNMRLEDSDAYTVFALVDEDQLDQSQLALAPDHLLELLEQRVPQLPVWFIAGFMGLYGSIHLPVAHDPPFTEHVTLDPFVWISAAESAGVRGYPAAAAALPPLEDLFGTRHPPAGPPEAVERYRRAWISEAALFVRWGLDGQPPGAPPAFWTFVDRAAAGPVTESACQQSFGLSYAQLHETLARYLVKGALRHVVLPQAAPAAAPLALRDATNLEIARIKGNWERLETTYVKQSYPALSDQYLAQARRSLRRAYDHGERDPRLLATMGLCECDAGDDAAALPFLTAATQARVVRPRAYFELGRILYERASAQPAGPKRRLGVDQTAAILAPLAVMRQQDPPLPGGFALLGNVWLHSAATPTPADLAPLAEGVRLFPRYTDLAYVAALLEIRWGESAAAAGTIARGLENADNDASRDRLRQLRVLLASLPKG
jgi:hypothetical protein